MARDEFTELRAFLEVARERSFTRAAAKLGVTQSALSHTIKSLEARIGVRLLDRTTRDVAPTREGERLREGIEPHYDGIATEIATLRGLSRQLSGNVRIVCTDDSFETVFRPKLAAFLHQHPDVRVELVIENGYTNIVESRFDAGVRLGELVALDMIAVRIGPDVAYAVVGSPSYLEQRPAPMEPADLTMHNCINYRLPTAGTIYPWEFHEGAREVTVRVEGQLVLNNMGPAVQAALDGIGLAYLPRELVREHIEVGRLRDVLTKWCPTFQGYHLYYPSRRHPTPAFTAFLNAVRHS